MQDTTLRMTMLFDFYGELLTEKQREYFDLYHNEDLSLSEIAERAGISRQGVYDIINRAERILTATEQKTGLVERWHNTRAELDSAEHIAKKISEHANNDDEISELSAQLLSIIRELKV
jgi:predicted DNA-binding protein YlxM (UPF0122 family)